MASRRILKKNVSKATFMLIDDALSLTLWKKDADEEGINKIVNDAIALYAETIARINHTEKGAVKQYYKALREHFTAEFVQLVNTLQELAK